MIQDSSTRLCPATQTKRQNAKTTAPYDKGDGRKNFAAESEKRRLALFWLQNLAATIHARFQVDMVGPAQLATVLVFHIDGALQRISGTAHSAF